LISDAKNREARERLKILEETNDGFKIAEADLKLRGPGELLGREQSGLPKFRFGNLVDDLDLISRAAWQEGLDFQCQGMVRVWHLEIL
jgi:ATP-dependent DNA helicase RecG